MVVHGALVAEIPGLAGKTPRHAGAGWGTLRVFPDEWRLPTRFLDDLAHLLDHVGDLIQ
jgi:hypothetical protein